MSAIYEPSVKPLTEQKPIHYSLAQHVKDLFQNYIKSLQGEAPCDVYNLFLTEFEKPFLESVVAYTRHNQSKAASFLGISRGTLRKKLKQHDLL